MLIPDPAPVARTVKQVLTTARVRRGAACEHLCTVILLRVTEDTPAKLLVQWPDAWKNLAPIFSFLFLLLLHSRNTVHQRANLAGDYLFFARKIRRSKTPANPYQMVNKQFKGPGADGNCCPYTG